ncbi:transporter [Blautia sp. RD014234]|nr:transporter [Blautia parvula]
MKLFFEICIGLTTGLIAGFVCAGLKQIFRKNYTEEEKAHARRMIDRFSAVLKYFTFLLLIIGLVWCVYFLVLGAMIPEQTDYANNMAELIVSVLTVISIIFAFVEFLRRKSD